MNALHDLSRHFWLARSMARTVGLHFGDALRDGRMTSDDYARIVASCARCSAIQPCMAWLGNGANHGTEAPAFCRNAETFKRLGRKPGTAAPAGENPV